MRLLPGDECLPLWEPLFYLEGSGSTFRDLQILQLFTLWGSVTPWTHHKSPISALCTCDSTLSIITQDSWSYVTIGIKLILNLTASRCLKAHVLWQQRDKLVQNLLCSTNPFISFLFLLPVTCEFHPKVNELPRLLQCIAAYNAHCLGLLEGHNTSAVCANFHSLLVARNRKTITCMLKTLFKRCKQYQIVRKNQTVDPAGSNSDILVEAFVFLYPIQINQC